jgi:hypothetical protein
MIFSFHGGAASALFCTVGFLISLSGLLALGCGAGGGAGGGGRNRHRHPRARTARLRNATESGRDGSPKSAQWKSRVSNPADEDKLQPNCHPLFARFEEQERDPAGFPCELLVDLNGDGKNDRVFLTSTDGKNVRLAVALAKKPAHLIGDAAHPLWKKFYRGGNTSPRTADPRQNSGVQRPAKLRKSTNPDFSWLVGWKVAHRKGRKLVIPGGLIRTFHVPDAMGEGVWMTSHSVAVMFYRSQKGWIFMPLGY